MSKRIKRVFTNKNEVLHRWANQTQSDARCSNVFFEGTECWSYGKHYKLGKLHKINGQTIALINSTKYSVTTTQHQSAAWQAVEHHTRLLSSNVDSIETALLESQDQILDTMFGVFNKVHFYENYVEYFLEDLAANITLFNNACHAAKRLELKLEISKEYVELVAEHAKLRKQREAELNSPEAILAKELKKQKRAEKQREKLAQSIEDWRAFKINSFPGLRELDPQVFRIGTKVDGGAAEIQTSRGATVPLSSAKRLLILVLNKSDVEGEKVGEYTTIGANDRLIKIGCHTFDIQEAKSTIEKYEGVE